MKTRANQAELSRILGCSESALSRAKKLPSFPATDDDRRFEILDVCVWWYLHKMDGARADPMLTEGDSEGLERYRMARAQLEEIKLAELQGQVVMMADLAESDRIMLAPLRQLQETLKRRQDNEAFLMVQECIDQMERGLTDAADSGEADL